MRHNPHYWTDDINVATRLIDENPWATLISQHDGELVASHYPMLVDDSSERLSVVTHVGRPDDLLHGLASGQVMLIFQGQHGYVSPSWYAPGTRPVPTWNFSAVHCWGTPEVLDDDANLQVLTRLTAHFEQHVESPKWLDPEVAGPVARGTVGLRIPIEKFTVKIKMSQDKDPASVQRVIDALRAPGTFQQPHLADDMERARAEGVGYPPAD